MNFKDFHSDSLEVRLQFAPEEFNSEIFLKAVSERGTEIETDSDGDTDVGFSFGSSDKAITYHAHLRVRLRKNGDGRAELSYHDGALEDEEEKPPFVDKSANWLGSFFKTESVSAHVHVNYTFDKSFSSVLALPFPLVTSEKALAGAQVSGVALVLPSEEGVSQTAIIQGFGDETFIFLRTDAKIDLKSFDLFSQLKTFSRVVDPLVKKQDSKNDTNTTSEAG